MDIKDFHKKALKRIKTQFAGNPVVPPGTDITEILQEFSEDYSAPALGELASLLLMGGVPDHEDISNALTEVGMIRDTLEQIPEEQRGMNEAGDIIYCDWLRREIQSL